MTLTQHRKPGLPDYLVNFDMPDDVVLMQQAGNLTTAISRLLELAQETADQKLRCTFDDEVSRLRILQRDYSLTREDMKARLLNELPKVSDAEFEQFTDSRALQSLTLDGELRYFGREPQGLYQVYPELAQQARRNVGDPAATGEGMALRVRHMEAALDAAKAKGVPLVLPHRYHVEHTVTVRPGAVPVGETIRCWLPFPQNYRQQNEGELIKTFPGNAVLQASGGPHRTLYMEQPASAKGARFEAHYYYSTRAYVPIFDLMESEEGDLLPDPEGFLEPREPHLAPSQDLRELAIQLTQAAPTRRLAAFYLWSYLADNIKWHPEMEYAVMTNIVEKVFREKRGDCGTQGLMFIAMARAVGIPARWQSGWVTGPPNWSLHDWAEYFDRRLGWLPVDPSIGRQNSSREDARDFLFGHLDAYRMIANLDYESPFQPAKIHRRSDPIDNQRGEVEWSGGNLFYDDFACSVTVTPVTNTDAT